MEYKEQYKENHLDPKAPIHPYLTLTQKGELNTKEKTSLSSLPLSTPKEKSENTSETKMTYLSPKCTAVVFTAAASLLLLLFSFLFCKLL